MQRNSNLQLVNTLKVTLPDTAIDSKSISELIGREDAKEFTTRIVPHFEPATNDAPKFGSLKSILMRLSKAVTVNTK